MIIFYSEILYNFEMYSKSVTSEGIEFLNYIFSQFQSSLLFHPLLHIIHNPYKFHCITFIYGLQCAVTFVSIKISQERISSQVF